MLKRKHLLAAAAVFGLALPGFATSRLDLIASLEAMRMLEDGVASAEDIDHALVTAYHAVRPLSAQARRLLPAMQRAGALRFWTSRLWDYHLPRQASVLKPHDPSHFERVLRQCVEQPLPLDLVPA
jgi:Ser/Thr protein kinase RdoA (MazF antagonist)